MTHAQSATLHNMQILRWQQVHTSHSMMSAAAAAAASAAQAWTLGQHLKEGEGDALKQTLAGGVTVCCSCFGSWWISFTYKTVETFTSAKTCGGWCANDSRTSQLVLSHTGPINNLGFDFQVRTEQKETSQPPLNKCITGMPWTCCW